MCKFFLPPVLKIGGDLVNQHEKNRLFRFAHIQKNLLPEGVGNRCHSVGILLRFFRKPDADRAGIGRIFFLNDISAFFQGIDNNGNGLVDEDYRNDGIDNETDGFTD